MRERVLGHLIAVDIGAVARGAILQHVRAARIESDFGVIARNFAAGEPEVVGLATTDLERGFRDRDDAPAERVGDFEAGLRHAANAPSAAPRQASDEHDDAHRCQNGRRDIEFFWIP